MGKNKNRAPASSSARSDEGGLIEQARAAAEAALRDVQKRLPADLVRQIEKTVGEGQKAVQSGLKAIQAQLKTTARQADVDKLSKRVDALARQVERMVAGRPTPSGPAVRSERKSAEAKATTSRAAATETAAARASSRASSADRQAGAPRARSARKAARTADTKPEGDNATSEGT